MSSTPSPELKDLYRRIVKRIHPDFAISELDRMRCEELMKEANRAYEAGDEVALREVLEPKASTSPPRAPSMSEQRENRHPPKQSPPPQAAKNVRSFKGWFWLSYTPWLVLWLASDLNNSWDAAGVPVIFFLLGIPVSFLIAANRTKLWSSGKWKPHVRIGAITAFAAIAFVLVCVLIDKTTSSHSTPSKTQVQQPSVPRSREATLPVPRIAAVGKLSGIYTDSNLSIHYPANWSTEHYSSYTVIFPKAQNLAIPTVADRTLATRFSLRRSHPPRDTRRSISTLQTKNTFVR
jgi:hypothetical protein